MKRVLFTLIATLALFCDPTAVNATPTNTKTAITTIAPTTTTVPAQFKLPAEVSIYKESLNFNRRNPVSVQKADISCDSVWMIFWWGSCTPPPCTPVDLGGGYSTCVV